MCIFFLFWNYNSDSSVELEYELLSAPLLLWPFSPLLWGRRGPVLSRSVLRTQKTYCFKESYLDYQCRIWTQDCKLKLYKELDLYCCTCSKYLFGDVLRKGHKSCQSGRLLRSDATHALQHQVYKSEPMKIFICSRLKLAVSWILRKTVTWYLPICHGISPNLALKAVWGNADQRQVVQSHRYWGRASSMMESTEAYSTYRHGILPATFFRILRTLIIFTSQLAVRHLSSRCGFFTILCAPLLTIFLTSEFVFRISGIRKKKVTTVTVSGIFITFWQSVQNSMSWLYEAFVRVSTWNVGVHCQHISVRWQQQQRSMV